MASESAKRIAHCFATSSIRDLPNHIQAPMWLDIIDAELRTEREASEKMAKQLKSLSRYGSQRETKEADEALAAYDKAKGTASGDKGEVGT